MLIKSQSGSHHWTMAIVMGSKKIGITRCPSCLATDIFDKNSMVVYMPRGLANPFANVCCENCGQNFIAKLTWDLAYYYDKIGVNIVGFSPANAAPFTKNEIDNFMKDFDKHHEVFLDIIEEEQQEGL